MRDRACYCERMRLSSGLIAVCALSAFLLPARAGVLFTYPFTVDYSASSVDVSIKSLNLDTSLGNQSNKCVCDDGFGVVFQSYPSNGSTGAVAALTNDSYFSIALTMLPGNVLNASSLTFDVGKGGDSDPRGYFIRSSADAFASDLSAVTLPSGAQQAPQAASVDLSGAPFQGLSSLELRFYVWTPIPATNSVDWNNVTLNGSVAGAAVPEPSTLLLLGAGLGLVLVRARRNRAV